MSLPPPVTPPPPLRATALPATALPIVVLTLLAALALAAPAAAQPDFLVGARAGYADLSGGFYDEIYDAGVTPLGVQGEVRWPAFSLRLAVERADADGDLFIPDTVGGNVLPGSDAELTLDLYHLTAAYSSSSAGAGGWSWFAGGGVSYADAEEDSVLGRPSDTAGGFHAAAGVRFGLGAHWELGGEAMYYTLSDLLALDGEGNDDLEGLSAVASLAYRF